MLPFQSFQILKSHKITASFEKIHKEMNIENKMIHLGVRS